MRIIHAVLLASACSGSNGSSQPDSGGGGGGGGELSDAGVDGHKATDAAIDAPAPPPIVVLRGVDRASAFSSTEATTLASNHGVKWTGVYIGGACNAGSGWTKSVVQSEANAHHWTFMPIWVGQQSPSICGADVLTASQGTADGNAAAAVMASTYDWQANRDIPICLDLEAGTYSYSPTGSLAYAKAWRDAVRAKGYLAYIYSNPTGINGLYDSGAKFDGAWPASWFYTDFANVSPSDLNQLGTRYTNQNRAWQYASFTLSGVGGIDADTSDLLLAPEPGGTNK